MSAAQRQFVVGHMVGTQKLTLAESQPLRALAPDFLVLHYHLAIWQSAPSVTFIVDGVNWGNDYPTVTMNESWFWHNQAGMRVAAIDDGKLLMNVGDSGFASYWKSSILAQSAAGDYDGVFADSAAPDLLQWEAQSPPSRASRGTGARDTAITELGGETYIQAWQAFMTDFNAALAAARAAAHPEHRLVHHQLGHHGLQPDGRRLRRGLRRSVLRAGRLAAIDEPDPGAGGQAQDRHRAELPGRLDRRGDAALLPGQLPADSRRPQLPRLLCRRAARVVPGVGRRARRAGHDGGHRRATSPPAAPTSASSPTGGRW